MRIRILSAAIFATCCTGASAAVTPKNAGKAMLNIFAYDSGGKLLRSGQAFFIDGRGNAATSYALLKGAASAEVIDAKGKKHAVRRILGANSTTDIVKFSTDTPSGNEYFSITSTPAAQGATLQLVRYSTDKKAEPKLVSISKDEAYNDFRYYYISAKNTAENIACPLIDENGSLVAIVQQNVGKDATTACAIDARFINELKISATSSLNSDLKAIGIPKALPSDIKEAGTYLYMMPQADSLACANAYSDFIETWPSLPDGYSTRAAWYASRGDYSACEADFATAFEKAKTDTSSLKADALHYSLSDLIYRTAAQRTDSAPAYPGWTLQRAEQEADLAYAAAPYTLYLSQKGKCQFAQRDYAGAYQSFSRVCEDKKFASAESYFSAARSLELSGGDSLQVLALLDSCVAHIATPATAGEAQFFLERSQRLLRAGRYRLAVLDYNEYEKAVGPKNLTAQFYYLREQAEMEAHMYQQALDDIRTAIATSDNPLFFRLEEAYILLRVGEFQPAIDAATSLLKDLPESPDCYKIIGIAHGELGHKAIARQNLLKAQQLGDTTVESFISKYKTK